MGKTEEKITKWHAVNYAGQWSIQDSELYDGKDVLSSDDVGPDEAFKNANLAAAAPELLATLKNISMLAMTSGGTAGPDNKLIEAISNSCELINKYKL